MRVLRITKDVYKEEYELGEVLQGGKTEFQTLVSACYTKDALCFRLVCKAAHKLVAEYEGPCTPVWRGDVAEVFVSPYGDMHWYYECDVAPNGSNFNARVYNPDDRSGYAHCLDDDDVITRAQVVEGGWIAEIEIPFAVILKEEDLGKIKELPWCGNVYRINMGNGEHSSFAPTKTEKITFHVPSAFAKWEFE